MQTKRTIIALMILSVPIVVLAEEFDPGARAKAIAPFLDEQTIGVAHVDLRRSFAPGAKGPQVDLDALEAWCTGVLELAQPDVQARTRDIAELREVKAVAEEWITEFTQAGGTEIFAVASLADSIEHGNAFLVVPLAAGADANAIANLLRDGTANAPASSPAEAANVSPSTMTTEHIGNAVVAAPPATLKRLRTITPAARPEVAKAFDAAGNTAVQVLLLPTADCRRVIEEMIPTLPSQLGGGPVTAVTRGAMWAALSIDTHPAISVQLVLQSENGAAAQAVEAVIDASFRFLAADAAVRVAVPDAESILASVQRTVTGDRLQLCVAPQSSQRLVAAITRPMDEARQRSNRLVGSARMKSIILACNMYANDHENQWPPDLQTLVDAELIPPGVLLNPLQPGEKVGFVYRKPALPMDKVDSRSAIIYEPYDTWTDGVWVAFADGHVEFVKDESRLIEALAKAQGAADK
ncbi:MAG: hypothetical protein JXA69_10050 [Phycisphaerae bacterium]|nr:hypothetical protein [Phycisphaerae bacterium]